MSEVTHSLLSKVKHIETLFSKRNMVQYSSEQRSEGSQCYHFNSSEQIELSECSQRFYFNSREVKERSEHGERSYFYRSDLKRCSKRSQRYHLNSNN